MSATTSLFTGNSTYSPDFQQAIDRAISFASLPLTQLQQQGAILSGAASGLSSLQNAFTSLQTAIGALDAATNSPAYSISASDRTVASASASGQVLTGTYNLEIVSLGSQATAFSADGLPAVSDPQQSSISAADSYQLTVNGQSFSIEPGAHSLYALAQAINASNAGVNATVINSGSAGSPQYLLALQATALAAGSIQLNDGSQDLLTAGAAGSPVQYRINGQPAAAIESDSRVIQIAPGLQATAAGTGVTDLAVTNDPAQIGSALSSFTEVVPWAETNS